ncbi:MAG: hypothetical protein ABIQ02_13920 [Saprospiraceae bacterium]
MIRLKNLNTKKLNHYVNPDMTRWLSLLLICAIPWLSSGQVGLNIKGILGQSKTLDSVHIAQNGMQVSLEYNFRLKQKRLEFRPGIGYRTTFNSGDREGNISSVDFDMNTAIYPFDFPGDCHCPTFSKSGKLFKKGFFIELNPGIGYQTLTRQRFDPDLPPKEVITDHQVQLKIGGSIGLDIGLSDAFTLTPLLTMTYLTPSDWDGLRRDGSTAPVKDYRYYGAGIRLTKNHDDKRRRRH